MVLRYVSGDQITLNPIFYVRSMLFLSMVSKTKGLPTSGVRDASVASVFYDFNILVQSPLLCLECRGGPSLPAKFELFS